MSDLETQIQTAISCHGMWKARLRQVIETRKTDLNVAEVAKDNCCDFGKWLYGTGRVSIPRDEHPKVVRLHAEFHTEAARILKMAVAGDATTANAAIAIGGSFSKASANLVVELKHVASKAA